MVGGEGWALPSLVCTELRSGFAWVLHTLHNDITTLPRRKARHSPHMEGTVSGLQVTQSHLDLCQGGHDRGGGPPAGLQTAPLPCSPPAFPLAVLVGLVCRRQAPEVGGGAGVSSSLSPPSPSQAQSTQHQKSIINWSTQ